MFAASQQRYQIRAFHLAQLNPEPYIHRLSPLLRAVMNQHAPDSRPRLTAKPGQYLAFIHAYRRLLGQSPAEADMQRFFQVASPRSIRWCYRSKKPASSHDNPASPDPSLSPSTPPTCQNSFRAMINQSKSLCRAARRRKESSVSGSSYVVTGLATNFALILEH